MNKIKAYILICFSDLILFYPVHPVKSFSASPRLCGSIQISRASLLNRVQHLVNSRERISITRQLVFAPAEDSRKTDGNA